MFIDRSEIGADCLNKYELEEARNNRAKQIQMWTIIREMLSYLSYLWIIYTITCSNRNNHAFLQVNHLRQFYLNIGHSNHDYTKVKDILFFESSLTKFEIDRLYQSMNIGHG